MTNHTIIFFFSKCVEYWDGSRGFSLRLDTRRLHYEKISDIGFRNAKVSFMLIWDFDMF